MAGSFSIHEELRVSGALAGSGAGIVNGAGFNIRGFEEVLACLIVGQPAAGSTLDVVIEESDDDGVTDPYTAIPNAAFSQKTDADVNQVYVGRIITNLPGRKAFIRLSANGTGNPSYCGGFLGQGTHVKPVPQDAPIDFTIGSLNI